ncbi:hypothetical protein I317_03520 [Kwoniella heveanensis CBS 569]|uniref:Zn(2)-C6 fungal-type domain-containing protein n=1 Tax=Kwoniella heveanensis BCC8398 TaxID=1296120 RepID=A0A1B9GTT0_9TREE|nr:hypothetical protein I316_03940 [Kwoniella heveanensis BCC8398]OCF42661.1 hypothetical protein I317_03520 [Kwoniella heveanensis CBS 569]
MAESSSSKRHHEEEDELRLTASGKPKRKRVRSVMGCTLCRKRRVKCDEKKPKCTNCSRHPLRVCEYEFDIPHEASPSATLPSQPSEPLNADAWFDDTSPLGIGSTNFASSSKVTLGIPSPLRLQESPSPAAYEEFLSERQVVKSMSAELRSMSVINPMTMPDPMGLADAFLSKLPMSSHTPFPSILTFHAALVKQCFTSLSSDTHSRLLCTATAVLSSRPSAMTAITDKSPIRSRRPDVFHRYLQLGKEQTGNVITGKLGAVAFTLLLCEALDPTPSHWREQVGIMVRRSVNSGGPGWVIGVTDPLPGYTGGQLINAQPLCMALYSELTAMLEIWSCLTSGGIPILLGSPHEKRPWHLASRSAQLKASTPLTGPIPDAMEIMIGIPRVMVSTFARVVGLVSMTEHAGTAAQSSGFGFGSSSGSGVGFQKRSPDETWHSGETQEGEGEEEEQDHMTHLAESLKMDLEYIWPKRLDKRSGDRRMWYGGRLWRLALLIMIAHKAQHQSLDSGEIHNHISAFLQLCFEALSELGHLTGWLWPIVISACACPPSPSIPDQRQAFLSLLSHAKSAIGDTDHSAHATRLLNTIWFYHDFGDPSFHLKNAIKLDPSLDVLIL